MAEPYVVNTRLDRQRKFRFVHKASCRIAQRSRGVEALGEFGNPHAAMAEALGRGYAPAKPCRWCCREWYG